MKRPFKLSVVTLAALSALGALSASTPASAVPNCPPSRPCTPIIPPPVVPTYDGTLYPDFQVLSIVYAAPGNKSVLEYGSDSTTGSVATTGSTWQNSLSVSATVLNTVTASGGWNYSVDSKGTIKVQKDVAQSLVYNSQVDAIDHDNDVFYVWFNPMIRIAETGGNVVITSVGNNGAFPTVIPLTAGQLKNPSTIPSYYAADASHLTSADRASILALDPYAAGTYVDPSRFVSTGISLPIDGPTISSTAKDVDTNATTQSTTWTNQYNVGLSVSGGISILSAIKVSDTFTWSDSSALEADNAQAQSISATLKTSTATFGGLYDVYYDKQFKSFVFVEAIPIFFPIRGLVASASGQPIAGERVTMSAADGKVLTTYTDGKGEYSFPAAAEGSAMIEARGHVQSTVVRSGQTAEIKIHD